MAGIFLHSQLPYSPGLWPGMGRSEYWTNVDLLQWMAKRIERFHLN
jgi:hypothetical protein